MTTNAIEIRGLEKRFPTFALGPIDITVPRGAIYGLIGPNGAGKTVTLDLIFRMGACDAGSIAVFGLDHVRDEVAIKQQIGYVSPDLNYRPWGTVGRAIRFVRGFYPTWDHDYCEHLLRALHLGTGESIATLSFGGLIKLSLLLALSHRPKLLVLDEPMVGLDAVARQQIFGELLAAVRDEERTVLISSHDLADLERFTDHVGMIKNGRMVFEGSTSEIVDRYRMVEVIADGPARIRSGPGCTIQRQDENRGRVLVDVRGAPADWARAAGVRPVAESPVSLEELFVALAKE